MTPRRYSPIQVVALLAMLGISLPEVPEMTPAEGFRAKAWLWLERQRSERSRRYR